METLWFIIVAVMLTVYVVLDGFDIGAGIIYLVAAKKDQERRAVLKAIGPVGWPTIFTPRTRRRSGRAWRWRRGP